MKWLPEDTVALNFPNECLKIAQNEEAFNTFKINSIFSSVIGNDNRDNDFFVKILSQIENKNLLIEYFDKFKTNDNFGSPKTYNSKYGTIGVGTLYFVYVLIDIMEKLSISKEELLNYNICEIGSGYGGQCKIISDIGFKEYKCVDIKETLSLCEKYLNLFNLNNVRFITPDKIETKNYDLVISNWCLSEFDISGMEFYIENIIKYCNKGFFLCNIWEEDRKNYLINKLSEYFSYVKVYDEDIKTHSNRNFTLVIHK